MIGAASALRTIQQQGQPGRKAAAINLEVQRWRELKMITALADSMLDKLLQDGAAMVVEKLKRTRSLGLES